MGLWYNLGQGKSAKTIIMREDRKREEHHKGEYTQDKIENAKKHLLESDDLLQQLQEKFSKLIVYLFSRVLAIFKFYVTYFLNHKQ